MSMCTRLYRSDFRSTFGWFWPIETDCEKSEDDLENVDEVPRKVPSTFTKITHYL